MPLKRTNTWSPRCLPRGRRAPGPRRPARWGTCAGCRLWDRDRCATRGATGRPSGYVRVDLNAAMIETARADAPAGAPVEWREGMPALPCADATFDVVCCQQGHQFSRQAPRPPGYIACWALAGGWS